MHNSFIPSLSLPFSRTIWYHEADAKSPHFRHILGSLIWWSYSSILIGSHGFLCASILHWPLQTTVRQHHTQKPTLCTHLHLSDHPSHMLPSSAFNLPPPSPTAFPTLPHVNLRAGIRKVRNNCFPPFPGLFVRKGKEKKICTYRSYVMIQKKLMPKYSNEVWDKRWNNDMPPCAGVLVDDCGDQQPAAKIWLYLGFPTHLDWPTFLWTCQHQSIVYHTHFEITL
jgi:hypothetical protein